MSRTGRRRTSRPSPGGGRPVGASDTREDPVGHETDDELDADVELEQEHDDDAEPVDLDEGIDDDAPPGYGDTELDGDAGGPEQLHEADERAPGDRAETTEGADWYGPLESITRRPRLFFLPIIVMISLALIVGLVRKPVYSSTSELIVGSVVRDYQVNEGQALAVSDLTDIYSRLVGSPAHMDRVDEALGAVVPASALTAAPIPNSALLRLDATGSSEEQASSRADAGAEQLVAYVESLRDESRAAGDRLLADISTASAASTAAEAALTDATNALAAATAAQLPERRQALEQAQAAATTAALKLDSLKSSYTAQQAASSGGITLTVFSPATSTGSDRKNQLIILGVGALLIGGLLGAALATLSANHWRLLPPRREPTVGG